VTVIRQAIACLTHMHTHHTQIRSIGSFYGAWVEPHPQALCALELQSEVCGLPIPHALSTTHLRANNQAYLCVLLSVIRLIAVGCVGSSQFPCLWEA